MDIVPYLNLRDYYCKEFNLVKPEDIIAYVRELIRARYNFDSIDNPLVNKMIRSDETAEAIINKYGGK
jgi:hypothetical protein